MDGMRYHVILKNALARADKRAGLLRMKEEDFSSVSREGRPVPTEMFVSVYSRFSSLADAEPAHTIEIYLSLASL